MKGCYYVDGAVDTSIVGEYKITIIAIDSNGLKVSKFFNVIVKQKETVAKKENVKTSTQENNNNVGNEIATEGNYVQSSCQHGFNVQERKFRLGQINA